MFDFNNDDEEKKRKEWYTPLGEFMILFSNLEFTCSEWIDLLCNSKAISNHIKSLWSFKKRIELIIELVPEYQVSEDKKELWTKLWKSIDSKILLRNIIAHNPPFNNFSIELKSNFVIKDIERAVKIHQLSKPLGNPGTCITLEKLLKCNTELREILIQLDYEYSGEIAKDFMGK